jgi:arylsulfatase
MPETVAQTSFKIDIVLTHEVGDEGILVVHGDHGGGYVIWVEDGWLRLAYDAYDQLLVADGILLPAGKQVIQLVAEAIEAFRWDLSLLVEGERVTGLERVPMLVGLAPFSGIDVGVNRGGPVRWDLHVEHRAFPYTGALGSVTYAPGPPAGYPQARVERVREVALLVLD